MGAVNLAGKEQAMTLWFIFGIFFVAGFLDRLITVRVVPMEQDIPQPVAVKKPSLTVIEGGKE